jgi:hypothetical protein
MMSYRFKLNKPKRLFVQLSVLFLLLFTAQVLGSFVLRNVHAWYASGQIIFEMLVIVWGMATMLWNFWVHEKENRQKDLLR